MHDGEPVLEGGEVATRGCFACLEGLDGPARTHQYGEAGRAADAFLGGGKHDIEAPVVEADFFATDATDAVDYYQGFGADSVDEVRQGANLAKNAGAGVHMCDGEEFIFLLFEGSLHLGELGAVANRRFQLGGSDAVGLEAVGEGVGKVAGVQDEDVFVALGKVGSNEVPAEGAAAGDDEGLRGGVGGEEELAEHGEGVAEGGDEGGGDVGFAVGRQISIGEGREVRGMEQTCNGS